MSPEQIDNLPAGRELDTLIAEKIMGWTYIQSPEFLSAWQGIDFDLVGIPPGENTHQCLRFYSQFIGHVWPVIEKLRVLDPDLDMALIIEPEGYGVEIGDKPVAYADTAPLAICRAALKAIAADYLFAYAEGQFQPDYTNRVVVTQPPEHTDRELLTKFLDYIYHHLHNKSACYVAIDSFLQTRLPPDKEDVLSSVVIPANTLQLGDVVPVMPHRWHTEPHDKCWCITERE